MSLAAFEEALKQTAKLAVDLLERLPKARFANLST